MSEHWNESTTEHNNTQLDMTHGERALWRAVITQALMDAGSDSKKPEMKLIKSQATSWLTNYSRELATVCEMADLNMEHVVEQSKHAIDRGCKWRRDSVEVAEAMRASRKASKVKTQKRQIGRVDVRQHTRAPASDTPSHDARRDNVHQLFG